MSTTPSSPAPTTRDAILDAAEHLFAAHGFEGASIKAIGERSGTNSALLYYYFEGKEDLYRACLIRLLEEFSRKGQAQLEGASPEDAIERLVTHQVSHLTRHPNLVRLVVREMLDHEGAVAGPVVSTVMRGMFTRFTELIRQGQREGSLRRDLDPELAAVSTLSQMMYFLIAQPALRQLLGEGYGGADGGADVDGSGGAGRTRPERRLQGDDTPAEPLHERFARHAAAFALAALRAPPSATGSTP